jgi:membrane associated rhomboid family serine protease
MFRLTPVIRNIIIINIVIFLLQELTARNPNFPVSGWLALWDFNSGNFRPYQFFTYMFAHGSWGHIFFNMLALASFGPILEGYWGDKKFLIFYTACGIGAGVIYAGVNYFLGGGGPMLGASGALYGILMAFGLVFPNLEIMLLFPPIPIKAKYMVFIMGFITYALDSSGQVAHLAHFGGAFVAFILISVWRSQGSR